MEAITHPITPEGQEYLKSVDEQTRKLHAMAQQKLGSSYFVERTNGFRKWKAEKKPKNLNQGSQPQSL